MLPYDKIILTITLLRSMSNCNIYYMQKNRLYYKTTIQVYMEGVSYGSVGSAALVDLFLKRILLESRKMELSLIVSPTSFEEVCANGRQIKSGGC